jgi:hypothetical protein
VFRRPLAPRRPEPDRQCTATSTTTDARCERFAITGDDLCPTHRDRTTMAVTGGQLSTPRRTGAAVTASVASVQIDGVGWQTWKFGSAAWQREAWRLYDVTGQLRFVANWVGHSVSRCRLYVAEVDESGEAGQEATDQEIASLAAGPLGSGPAKDEALRLLGINLFVPGEAYVVAEADADGSGEDRWFVVAGQQIRRMGDDITIRRSQIQGGGDMLYRPDVDLILRVWTPHPADTDQADSPTRSAIPDLREIEALRKREFAELDSRLAGAGVLFLPDGVDFPRADTDPPGVHGLSSVLQRAMAASLRDRSSAEAMVPIIAKAPADVIAAIRHMTFWSDLNDQLLPLREAAVKSLAQSLDVPAEILLGLADSNHWCTVPDVEIMSRTGWKTYDQLAVGEDVLTLNHDTGLSEWQPLLAVNTWDVVDEPMVAIRGRGHSSLTTARHRWPTLSGRGARRRAWDTSGSLMEQARSKSSPDVQMQDYLLLAAPSADLPAEAKHSDALVEMVAWYFTEGALGVRPGRRTPKVTIYQSRTVNPENCDRITRALTALFGPASERLDKGGRYATPASVARRAAAQRLRADHPDMSAAEIGRRLGVTGTMAAKYLASEAKVRDDRPRWRQVSKADGTMATFVLNSAAAEVVLAHAPDRVVSLDFIRDLTAAQLELFIDTAVRGDGHVHTNGTIYFGQKDPRMCDAIELAAILSGRYVNRYTVTNVGRSAAGSRQKIQHAVTIGTRTTFAPRGRSFTEQPFTGTIWCPTTPNGTWLARHEGTVFYTGNSAWQVSEDAVTTQIVPVLSRIADALTTGYLRRVLEQMGKDPAKWTYAFDTAPLTTRPNRTADALNYHGAGLLSDAAAVEAGAFRLDQMPDEEERLRRIVERAVSGAPSLLADPMLQELLGFPPSAAPPPAVEGGTPPPPPAPAKDPESPPEPTPQTEQDAASLTPVANLAVRRALTLAGSRLVPHRQRDRCAGARYDLHTCHGPVAREQADTVLRGAWDDLPAVAADLNLDPAALEQLLHGFTTELLTRGMAYDPGLLRDLVSAAVRGKRLNAHAGIPS